MSTREVALADLALGQAVERDQHVIGELLLGQFARDGRQRGDEARSMNDGSTSSGGRSSARRNTRFECRAGAGARTAGKRHDGDALTSASASRATWPPMAGTP
jgi:hypothetical protein